MFKNRAFVSYVEQSFRERSLRCAVLLMPRASLASVVKRQILEGVLAVVKLYRGAQNTGKIPLQLFDRSGGVDNVRFEGLFSVTTSDSTTHYLVRRV